MSEYMKHILEIEKVKKEADELMMKKIDHYEKELAFVREDAQIQILRLDNRIGELAAINAEHQKLNGELRKENQDLVASNKANMSLIKSAGDRNMELREDNKKLARQVDDYVNKLRKAGLV